MAPASSILITTTSKANYQLPEIGYGYSSFGAPRLVACSFGSSSIRTVCSAVTSSGKPEYAVSSSLVSPSAFSRERRQVRTISVFGRDEEECGTLINSIAGIFGRRGHNIDSLTVLGSINNHNGLFTIVLVFPATDTVFQQLVTHLNNLRNVFKVEEISTEPQVERELVLIKLRADQANKDEIMWLVKIFRAKIVDTSESCMTIEVSGDPGKLAVILRNVKKFGIKEIARTGKIALRRESMGDCKFPASSCQDLMENIQMHVDATKESNSKAISSSRVNSNWVRLHTISMLVNDAPGVLNKITGIISSRGYKIKSLAVGQAEKEGLSRMALVLPGTDESIGNLVRRLHKLTDLDEIEDVSHVPFVERELMLIKIATNTEARRDILDIANIFRAEAVDVSDHSITLQLTGDTGKMVALQSLFEPYDIREVARTGRVALVRESGVNSTYLRG